MLIAKEKKNSNISEYILYMWQVEDLIRALKFDVDAIIENVIKVNSSLNDSHISEYKKWYSDIIEMMTMENIKEKGHLQVIINIISDLNNLHVEILSEKADQLYVKLYSTAQPNIIEFTKRLKGNEENEIEVIFNALYILLLLRMQKKEISKGTSQAMDTFSQLLAYLTKKYHERDDKEKTQWLG